MSLTSGTKLGPYEIVAPIGAGGMGEVYRARDTRLNRDVAIKVLPAAFAEDADRLARFTREAQTLASLNHPNIAQIFGLETTSGVVPGKTTPDVVSCAIVMELVDGRDLSEIIAGGPQGPPLRSNGMSVAEALSIAKQIAEALEAAHELGIVHRDLKPANIKVRADGTVKVLDFGLAKASAGPGFSPGDADVANSPTMTSPAMTEMGMILGTAAYMSPEQAAGKAVDKRSDLWSFGVVLYEMLTGQRLFTGETVSHVMAAVLTKDPDWTTLPPNTPPQIRRLLRRCLERDRKRRLDSAAAARFEIDDAMAAPSATDSAAALSGSRPRSTWLRALPWAVAAAALAIALAAIFAWRSGNVAPLSPVYSTLDAPAGSVLAEIGLGTNSVWHTPIVFTPDGLSLIIQAERTVVSQGQNTTKSQLFLRSLGRPDAQPIAGTDDAYVPFVSPDGKWIGFAAAGEIRKVPIGGGEATTICKSRGRPYGAAWGVGDVVVFGDPASRRIMRVSANGGTPVAVTAPPPPASRRRHVAPFVLPDGTRILFSDVSAQDASDSRLMVQSLDGGDATLVVASATDGRLLPSGRLAFMRLGTLMTMAFDLGRAEAIGDAVAAMGNVMQSGLSGYAAADNTGAGMFAVSSLGSLAVIRGPLMGQRDRPMIWVTRDGRRSSAEPAAGAPTGSRHRFRISPDRSRAIVQLLTPLRDEMWLADWTRNVWTACGDCTTSRGAAEWSPDGRRLLFGKNDALVAHTTDGSAPDQVLLREAGRSLLPSDWLTDGRIVYLSSPDEANYEIKYLEAGGNAGQVVVPLGTGTDADVSPDGRWLAYRSGTNVFVQAFPGPGSRTQVSTGNVWNPRWSADGRTLYYMSLDSVFAVDMAAAGTAGTPRELFRHPAGQNQSCNVARCYDISPDGPRFLFSDRTTNPPEPVTRMDLVLNWTATLGKAR